MFVEFNGCIDMDSNYRLYDVHMSKYCQPSNIHYTLKNLYLYKAMYIYIYYIIFGIRNE